MADTIICSFMYLRDLDICYLDIQRKAPVQSKQNSKIKGLKHFVFKLAFLGQFGSENKNEVTLLIITYIYIALVPTSGV